MHENDNAQFVERLKKVEASGISSTRFNNIPKFWKKTDGTHIFDWAGNEYIDCTSSYGVMGIGYVHTLLNKKVKKQIDLLSHTMCEIYPHEAYLIALEKIKKVIGRKIDDQVLLTLSGSEAIEVALKLSYRYTKSKRVIAFKNSFHGQSLGALNVTGQASFRTPFIEQLADNTTFVDYPNVFRSEYSNENEQLEVCIKQIQSIIDNGISQQAPYGAIVVEPMQNAAGYIVPPRGFLQSIRKICDDNNILLIVDEIFTGFGRSGKWLACDYEKVIPDIVCVGKVMGGGFPAAACVASKEIMNALDYEGMVPLHGSTFVGNALACTAISTTIDILEKDNLVEKSYSNGNYIRNSLWNGLGKRKDVGDIRGMGSATMIEFVVDKKKKERNMIKAKEFALYLEQKGIICLISGLPFGNCIALCVPFVINDNDLNYIINVCNNF